LSHNYVRVVSVSIPEESEHEHMTSDPRWIAERELEFTENGSSVARTIIARIGSPQPDEGSWRCATLIEGAPTKNEIFHAYGEDSMQALLLAMQALAIRLQVVGRAGTLTWLGDDDLGLPQPQMRTGR
jgi:hypothetical protein